MNDAALSFRAICSSDGKRLKWEAPFRVWVQEGGTEDSVSAWVFRNRQARLTLDTQKEDLWNAPPWPARSGVHVPLLAGKRPVGVLAVDSPTPNAFTNNDLRVLELLATEVAVAVENAWHEELMRCIGSLLTHTAEVPMDEEPSKHRITILAKLAMIIWEVMKPKACSVIVPPGRDEDQRFMSIPNGCEYGIDRAVALPLPKGRGLYGATVRTGRIQESKNVMIDKRFADTALARSNKLVSALSVPIRKDGQPYGALNYYSSFERSFSKFERHSLETVCGIAGMIVSATEAETLRQRNILHHIGTGVALIGLPPDWSKRKRAREKGESSWNLDIRMPLIFLNRVHDEVYSPKARLGMDCYRGFNNPSQRRPCWWCPTIRAMLTGTPKTSFTHSPAPPKNRLEHFKVTASILKENGEPSAAIESTVPATRELEGRNLSARLLETDDEDEVLKLSVECLGRGTRNDCIFFVRVSHNQKHLRIERIYTVDPGVLKEEREATPEWRTGTLRDDFPPLEDYFMEREKKGHRLFKERPTHRAIRKALSPRANEIIRQALESKSLFLTIKTHDLLEFFRGTTLLNKGHFANCEEDLPPRAVVLRLGSWRRAWGCLVMLDKKPGRICFEEPGHGRHWCSEIASELTTKLEGIRVSGDFEQLARLRETIMEQTPAGVITTDAKGTITWTNRAWREMAGGDAVGRNVLRLKSVKEANLTKEFKKALKGTAAELPSGRFRTVFGKTLTISAKCVPLFNKQEEVSGLLISCWDLSEVARYHGAVADERERVVLGNLAAGAVHEMRTPTLAATYRARDIIRKVPQLLNYEHKLLAGPLISEAGDLLKRVQELVSENVTPETMVTSEIDRKTFRLVKSVLQSYNTLRDDDTIYNLARMGVAPVLREVLSLGRGQHTETVLSYFENLSSIVASARSIYLSVSQISELIEALESQSYIAPEHWKMMNVEHPIEAALVILRHVLEEYNTVVNRHYNSQGTSIYCIPGQLGQVWRNLLQNSLDSIKYAHRRGIIDITTIRRGESIVVAIRDNGTGIPVDIDVSSLGASLPKLKDGTPRGLGFWLIGQVIEKHGGKVKIRSQRRLGTVVKVILPLQVK